MWREIAETLSPRTGGRPHDKDGVPPPLMVLLTIVTGLVDAVAYLELGHVFVANMTGNVVFLGFSAAGAGGLSVAGLAARTGLLPRGQYRGSPAGHARGR
ncbi:MAG TPA: YoaK family protein [Pseudonocardiaceae bacterium]